jgi:hypothetical protein
MSKTLKKIILVLVIFALVGVGASLFLGDAGSETTNPLQSLGTGETGAPLTQSAITNTTVADTEEINREFISMLLNLQTITLTDDIFSEPAFEALVDNTVRLNQPGNEGRPNPFAPIGSDTMFSSTDLQASAASALESSEQMDQAQTEENSTPSTNQIAPPANLESIESSDQLLEEQLNEVLSSLGAS